MVSTSSSSREKPIEELPEVPRERARLTKAFAVDKRSELPAL